MRCFGAALGGRDRSPPCRRCRRAMGCEAWPSSSPISATVSAGRGAVGPGVGRAGPCRAGRAITGCFGAGLWGGFPRPPPLGALLSPWPPRRAARGSAASRNGDAPRGGGGRCGGGRRARAGSRRLSAAGLGLIYGSFGLVGLILRVWGGCPFVVAEASVEKGCRGARSPSGIPKGGGGRLGPGWAPAVASQSRSRLALQNVPEGKQASGRLAASRAFSGCVYAWLQSAFKSCCDRKQLLRSARL